MDTRVLVCVVNKATAVEAIGCRAAVSIWGPDLGEGLHDYFLAVAADVSVAVVG